MQAHRFSYLPLRALAALVLGACAANAIAGSALTEAEALRLGLSRPELSGLQRARVEEAEADRVSAATWANPTLELSRDNTGRTGEKSWQIVQPLDLSGRRGLREAAANHRVRATGADNLARQNELVAELRHAFHDVLRQQETQRAVGGWLRRFAVVGSVTEKLVRAGEVAGYDSRRLAREQRGTEAKLAEADAGLERARARLAALIGRDFGDGIEGQLLPDAPPPLPALQARLAARPDFAALAARAEASRTDAAAAQRKLPELTVGIGGKRVDDGALRENGNLATLSFALPLFDRQQASSRRSAAQAAAVSAELGLARQRAEGELLGLHRQTMQLIAAAARYRNEAVAPSTELVRIAETAYRAGETTVLDLLDAYRGALDAELAAIDLEWKARAASIELDQLTGNHPL